MGLFRRKPKLLLYSEKDVHAYEKYVEESIGKFDDVFHEIYSPDLHIDVILIKPTPERDYYTLVTMGMGAYKMRVPKEYGKINRAEIAIRLPKEWEVSSNDEKWYWPIRTLKTLARLPYTEHSWLGFFHDVDFAEPFYEETELCAILLDYYSEDIAPLSLANGDQVVIYNAIPIYRSEMEYKNQYGAEELINKMSEETISGPVDIHRKSVV